MIVGPHATDLIEAAVVALDAEATIETVADGMAPHPTLSEGLRKRVWSRSAGRFTSRHAADRQRVGYPGSMSFYNRRTRPSATSLKAMQRAIERKRRKRRSGLKVAAYVGLGLVSAGILAAAVSPSRSGAAAETRGDRFLETDAEIVGEYVTAPEPVPAT